MPIDLDSEFAKLADANGQLVAEILAPGKLLAQVIRKGNWEDFQNFFSRYRSPRGIGRRFYPGNCAAIFGPRWMARFEPPHLKWLYHILITEDFQLKHTARIVADRRIAVERRAWCFHAVFAAETRTSFTGITILPHFWWYNPTAWNSYIDAVGMKSADAFIRRLGCADRRGIEFSPAMAEGAKLDSVGLLEINRSFDNRMISDSLMRYLILQNAAQCFVHQLANQSARVFKLRSPQEWLLTVCRCAREELAVAAVTELERQFPGLVAGTRDPWGGNPLWSVACNSWPTEKLRETLIRFGCDPEEENEFGISSRLFWENDPLAPRQQGSKPSA